MVKPRRCTRCGNKIPQWSGSTCPVCGRITSTERRFWKGGRKRFPARSRQTYGPAVGRVSAERFRGQKAEPSTVRPREKEAKWQLVGQSSGRQRLYGFNQLLREVYGQPVRMGRILAKQGISMEQVARWRQDGHWLIRFLRRLRLKLMMLLRSEMPDRDPFVLSLWYGLDGEGLPTAKAIGEDTHMSAEQVRAARRAMLAYLRGIDGRAALEKTMLDAANEIEQNHTFQQASEPPGR